ncbi:MAG: hypothetical protein JXP34_22335 [Planctomycetes bacterium]|nr:hypothetical protein [Planctomycetota bacterium]
MQQKSDGGISVVISDPWLQRRAELDVDPEASIRELVDSAIGHLSLPRNDASGRSITFHARLEREGRHMNAAEIVREALRTSDHLILEPDIDAGR